MTTSEEEYTLAPQGPRLSFILHGKSVVGHLERHTTWAWVLYVTPAKSLKTAEKLLQQPKDRRGGYAYASQAFWAFKHHHTNLTKEAS